MDDLVKAVAIGVVGSICALLVKKSNPELAMAIGVAAILLVCLSALSLLSSIGRFINDLVSISGLSPAIVRPVVKNVGIAIVTKIGSDLCRDAGELAVASSVELVGVALAVITALPLLMGVLELVRGLIT